ncbi:hypothetical protein C1H46_014336 [Malus baccata]|uniref:Uncharacterized protein n=1 Tax=Malus baccata TaxID=106549 RepID=A0A540MPD1_MALBA|nr:hypothetical protein C1H46_014336 [Malus baccata]
MNANIIPPSIHLKPLTLSKLIKNLLQLNPQVRFSKSNQQLIAGNRIRHLGRIPSLQKLKENGHGQTHLVFPNQSNKNRVIHFGVQPSTNIFHNIQYFKRKIDLTGPDKRVEQGFEGLGIDHEAVHLHGVKQLRDLVEESGAGGGAEDVGVGARRMFDVMRERAPFEEVDFFGGAEGLGAEDLEEEGLGERESVGVREVAGAGGGEGLGDGGHQEYVSQLGSAVDTPFPVVSQTQILR